MELHSLRYQNEARMHHDQEGNAAHKNQNAHADVQTHKDIYTHTNE